MVCHCVVQSLAPFPGIGHAVIILISRRGWGGANVGGEKGIVGGVGIDAGGVNAILLHR